jgi:hypothetical protein
MFITNLVALFCFEVLKFMDKIGIEAYKLIYFLLQRVLVLFRNLQLMALTWILLLLVGDFTLNV